MNAPNQPHHQSSSMTTNAPVIFITPPNGWQLRTDLTQEEMVKLMNIQHFCQQGCSRVAAMRIALLVFHHNQVYLGRFQPPQRNTLVSQAIQEMTNTTSMHWQLVTLAYEEFLVTGFSPPTPTKKADHVASPASNDGAPGGATITATATAEI